MTTPAPAWTSWLGIVAVVLGVLLTAEYATELTRHAVITQATPADGEFPPAACPADELEEEGLSLAECHQLVSNVGNLALSSPAWFSPFQMALASLGMATALASALVGAGLLNHRLWAPALAGGTFAALAALDTAGFIAALNAGPIVRDMYLWDLLRWLTVHLGMTVAAVAGYRQDKTALGVPGQPAAPLQRTRPFSATAIVCHWTLALSIFFLFASSWWMLALPLPSAEFTFRAFPFQLHKNLGITLVVVVAALLYVRFRRPPARPTAATRPRWMHRIAVADHAALYVLIVVASVSGYMSSSYSGWGTTLWWLVELPNWGYEDDELNMFYSDIHLWSCWGLLGVVALHISGALYHAFSDDGFVTRMLRP